MGNITKEEESTVLHSLLGRCHQFDLREKTARQQDPKQFFEDFQLGKGEGKKASRKDNPHP